MLSATKCCMLQDICISLNALVCQISSIQGLRDTIYIGGYAKQYAGDNLWEGMRYKGCLMQSNDFTFQLSNLIAHLLLFHCCKFVINIARNLDVLLALFPNPNPYPNQLGCSFTRRLDHNATE